MVNRCPECQTDVYVPLPLLDRVTAGTAELRCWPCVKPLYLRAVRANGVEIASGDGAVTYVHQQLGQEDDLRGRPLLAACTPVDPARRTWILPGMRWLEQQPGYTVEQCTVCRTEIWVSPRKVAAAQAGIATLYCWPCARPELEAASQVTVHSERTSDTYIPIRTSDPGLN